MMTARAFRLFVSSTFADFAEERRLLQEEVFPNLESHCAACGYGFRAVDMRWGVGEGAQLDQRTAEICLDEVLEAREYPAPNLLVLLGDRYGWIPLPFAIAEDEFDALRDALRSHGKSDIVVELGRVYKRDDNHLIACGLRTPPGSQQTITAYTLRSREEDIPDLKEPGAWAQVEARLRDALQMAAQQLHGAGRLDNAGRDKYFSSLTEQEIRKGLGDLATGAGQAAAQTISLIRTANAGEPQVRMLAEFVRRRLPESNFAQYERDDFVSASTAKLKAAIDRHIAAVESQALSPDFALQTERAIHHGFAAGRLRVFVGRESNRAAIATYIVSDALHPYVLRGISGSGKSALMARAAADAAAVLSAKVVQRFVGASAASADQRTLLISIVEDLAALGVAQKPEQWEDDADRFVAQVRDVIAAIDRPVVIFVDALDQIRPPYRPAWLPDELKPKVKIVVSVLDDEAFATEREIVLGLQRRLPSDAFLEIEPLSARDGRDILAGFERQAHRSLQPVQRDFIVERFLGASASPLYLRIAFDIARRWRSTHDPLDRGLAGDVTSLIGQFIDELSSVHHHEPQLVRRTLGLLAAGRDGLSESELIAVLSRDKAVMETAASERFGARTARLPDSVWVRLRRALSAVLVEKGIESEPLLHFFHRQVAEVVRAAYYEPERATLHAALVAYFDVPATAADRELVFSRRTLSELPYQLFHAQNRARLDALLTDPAWVDQKIGAFGGTAETLDDYSYFADSADPLQPLIGRALRLASGIIARDPRQRMSQLHGRMLGAGLGAEHARFLAATEARIPNGALIETFPALTTPGAEHARLEGHNSAVNALAVLPDGRLASSSGDDAIRLLDPTSGAETARLEGHRMGVHALAVLPEGRLVSSGGDRTIRLWDLATGAEIVRLEGYAPAFAALPDGRLASDAGHGAIHLWDMSAGRELVRLEGNAASINVLAALPDGRLVSGSGTLGSVGTIQLWDLASGRELVRLEGHTGPVTALVALPNGCLASGAHDRTIRLWNLDAGRELARLDHTGVVKALAALSDSCVASSTYDDSRILVRDLRTGREISRLEGHTGYVNALVKLPDGRIASGGEDRTVRIWDPESAESEVARSKPYRRGRGVNAIVELSDGRLASGHDDGTIRLWDPATGSETDLIEGHDGAVAALAALPQGCLASGGGGGAIQLWDAASGREFARLEGHAGWVYALATLPNGRLASAGNTIRLWDVRTARVLARLKGHADGVYALAAMPGGRFASGASDGAVRIWNAGTGRELARLNRNAGWVNALATLPDGRLAMASGTALVEGESGIRLWDPASARELAWFKGNTSIKALAAWPDGRLASGDQTTIRLWDTSNGCELTCLEIDSLVRAFATLSDGRLVAGDALGRLHWLSIKGAPETKPTAHAFARARTPAVAQPRERKPFRPADAASTDFSAALRPVKQRAGVWAGLIFTLIVLIAAVFAAMAIWGPRFGFSAAHDVLAHLLATFSRR